MTAWAMRLFYRLAEALLIGSVFAVVAILVSIIVGSISASQVVLVFSVAAAANFLAERR